MDPEVEFLDVGPSNDPRRKLRRRGLAVLIAMALVAVAIVALVRSGHKTPPTAQGSSTPLPTAGGTTPGQPTAVGTTPGQPTPPPPIGVTTLGHPLLPAPERFDLFGLGDGVVVRVQIGLGRKTQTALPTLQSTGPVDFVPAAGRVFIHPLDFVSGYVVPDGRQAVATARKGDPLLPGPDAHHLWVAAGGVLALTTLAGRRTGPVIRLPRGTVPLDASADGDGYALLTTASGIYDARPDGVHRISTGSLLAVGPTGWLVSEGCAHRCTSVLIDSSTGKRRVLGPTPKGGRGAPGVISPDGRTAAMFAITHTGTTRLYLLDLASGATRGVSSGLEQGVTDGTVAWSPDSRWLFQIGPIGQVRDIDLRDHDRIGTLRIALPPLKQLAIRP